jgi:nitroreductase
MDVIDAIKNRISVRKYLDKDVEEEKLNEVLEAGRLAPSASNRQEWRYIVVRDKSTRKKLVEAANNQSFVGEAPVVIVCCAETDEHIMSCGEKCYPIDLAISIDHMTLRAVELGLGTCWIGAFNQDKVKKLLGIPDKIRVVNLLPLGYPAEKKSTKIRKPLTEIVHYEKW